ncbi:MAG: DUF4012 domain-containing protein [Actinomycetota bacterium]
MSTGRPARRRAARRRRRGTVLRRALVTAGVALLAAVAAAAWLAWNGLQARDRLVRALPAVERLQAQVADGDAAAAQLTLTELQAATADARDRTDGPLWGLAGRLPFVGDDVTAATAAVVVVDDVAQRALPPAVAAAAVFDPAALQPKDGRIALEPIQQAAPLLEQAASEAERASAAAQGIRTDGVVEQIAAQVERLQTELADVAATARTGADAAAVLPGMLGADGPRSYLVLFQNNAEVRATGGLPGSFALITADQGQIALTQQASTADFRKFEQPVLDVPPDVLALHGENLVTRISDINLDPHFPLTAQLAREMWARRFGQQVDGVISTDPVALSYVLEATGPVPLATGDQLTAESAVPLLLAEVYARYEDPRVQNEFFASAAAASFEALVTGQGNPRAMVDQLARAAGEGRVLVWSAHEAEQAVIAGTVLEGALPMGDAARGAVGVYLNDGTRSKLSYYLQTSATLSPCRGREGEMQLELVMTSTAPADGAGLPQYVLGQSGREGLPSGSIRTQVLIYAPSSGVITRVEQGAEPLSAGSQVVSDRQVAALFVDLAPGELKTVRALLEANQGLAPTELRTTPGITASVTKASSAQCAGT